ncbi:MAG TPA: S8 family serine peptidase [Clostridia bacterium]|nr:S8 family serine peptidase [Clostridia bacterium]
MNLTTENKAVKKAFHDAGYKGQNITVAIIDNGYNGSDSRVTCVSGFDAHTVEDHGDIVVSILLEWLPEAHILSYNYTMPGASFESALCDIVQRAEKGGRYLVNVSQSMWHDVEHERLINNLIALGVPVFAASGNDGGNGMNIYPGNYPQVIAVAAANNDGSHAPFSSAYPDVDFIEVGTGVVVDGKVRNGTSIACPIALSKAALIMCETPTITEPRLYDALKASAADLGTGGFDIYTGWGHPAPMPKNKAIDAGKEKPLSRIPAFLAYLESKLGNVYVWGAQGQVLSAMKDPIKWITSMEKENGQSYVDRAIAFYNSVKASGKDPIEAFDCSGLIMFYVQNLMGWSEGDSSAAGLYASCTKLVSRAQLQPGDLCFIYSSKKGKMVHVGVYIGNGQTIEAYGRDLGVVKRPLGSGEWSHYGRLPVLQIIDNKEPKEETNVPKIVTKSNIGSNEGLKLQEMLNAYGYTSLDGKPLDEDGKPGAKTMEAFDAFRKAHGMSQTVEVPAALPETLTMAITIGPKTYTSELK